MIAIITGDIIDSRQKDIKIWLKSLKTALNLYGKEPKNWEIYRGDSFQLEVAVADALQIAISIKAMLKQEDIDIRMAIGIGEKDYVAKKITESNGSAFVHSGECFEALKKNTLALKSPWSDLDYSINIMLDLAMLTIDNWSATSAEIVATALDNPDLNQKALTKILNKTQSTISEGFKRAGYDEVLKMIQFYKFKTAEIC